MSRLALLALIVLACVGCDDKSTPDFDEGSGTGWRTDEYKGHTYVQYGGGKLLNGIAHDPDCRCRGWSSEAVPE